MTGAGTNAGLVDDVVGIVVVVIGMASDDPGVVIVVIVTVTVVVGVDVVGVGVVVVIGIIGDGGTDSVPRPSDVAVSRLMSLKTRCSD